MLRTVKQIQGFSLQTADGDIGRVHEVYFDDLEWVIRYVVVDTGNWLTGRRVLISPIAFGSPNWDEKSIPVSLTREQVENAPGIEADEPVSRQHEIDLTTYYGWPVYWPTIPPVMGAGPFVQPAVTPKQQDGGYESPRTNVGEEPPPEHDPHLQSTREVFGYAIQARDGRIGKLDDFVFDDETWTIRYLIVDTGGWLMGRKVLVSPSWVADIDWEDSLVRIDLGRDTIQDSPAFDPSQPIDREYESDLHDHYRRGGY